MDYSRGLITKVVDESAYRKADRAINSDFLDEDCISVWSYIGRHWANYKDTPSRDAVQKAFPNFRFTDYKEPVDYFIDALQESYQRNILDDALEKASRTYLKDVKEAEGTLRRALSELHMAQKSHRDVDVIESALDRVSAYEDRERDPGADGILSGWNTLDYQTLGFHSEEFIVLVGEKYMGKSWKMLWMAYQAVLQGENVLFVTKEMSPEAVIRRFDSIYAQVKFDSLRRGELSEIEKERYTEKMGELHVSSHKFVVARAGVHTIEDIESKAIERESTIVFVDSVYLFPPDSTTRFSGETQKRMAISQKSKTIAQNLGIPMVVSVQGGRRNAPKNGPLPQPDLDQIEWSNAFSQDADTVFYTQKDEIDKELGLSQMWVLKSRDGDLASFHIKEDFEYMQFEEVQHDTKPKTQVFEDNEEVLFNEES